MYEIKFYKSPWKAIKLILLASPFVIICLHDIIYHSLKMPPTLDWFGLCFFGLGIPLGLFNLLDRRPEMIINEEGIFDRLTTKTFIEWNLIKNAYLKDINTATGRFGSPVYSKQIFVCLVLDPNTPILLNANKTLVKLSEKLGFQGVSIDLSQLKKSDWQKFTDFIKSMSHANNSERQKLLLNYEQ